MFLGYSLSIKSYRCFNYRTKTIVECTNVRIDEKFGSKEKMLEQNFDEKDDNYGIVRHNVEVLFETNNNLQNDVYIENREEYISLPR